MKIFWTFLMIASSCFAIPISCTGGMFAGANYLSHHNTVYFDAENTPKENFYVLATDNSNQLDYFSYNSKHSADDYLKNYPERRFTIDQSDGKLITDPNLKNQIKFSVLEQNKAMQTIELNYSQDSNISTVARYTATKDNIQPTSQRSFSMALFFDAFPYALAFAILFSILGKAILSLANKKSACALPACK